MHCKTTEDLKMRRPAASTFLFLLTNELYFRIFSKIFFYCQSRDMLVILQDKGEINE